jgi:hypothetical protein
MTQSRSALLAIFVLTTSLLYAQLDRLVIPAGTPEDQALNAINNEQDAQKRLPMYQDFLEKFAANPIAVAFANWQLSQYYQTAGDLRKAAEAGDKAAAAAPHNIDILISQVTIAQGVKDNSRVFKYSIQGGEAFGSIEKQPKAAEISDQQFAANIASEKAEHQDSYDFFAGAAYNAIAAETDAKTRMDYIDQYTPVFPKSKFDEQIVSYAMLSLSQLKDERRLTSYAEKALAANPDNLPALLLLANSYVDGSGPGGTAKALTYAQRAIVAAKADDPNADKSRKISAGVAHSVAGRAYAKQEKTALSVTELKSATALLKGQDDQQFAVAGYYLGWDYAKLNRLTEARGVLNDVAAISGPVQQPAKDLLTKVNTARAAGK